VLLLLLSLQPTTISIHLTKTVTATEHHTTGITLLLNACNHLWH